MENSLGYATVVPIVLLSFFWRIIPLLRNAHSGCDAYYYLLCTEEFKQNRKIPIVLPPYYVLENREQWYPPGFAVFLSLVPRAFLDKIYWCISPAVDSLICGTAFLVSFYLMGNLSAAVIASLIYIFSPAAVTETQYLTSRQIGALFYVITAAASIAYQVRGQEGWLVVALASGILLLMTHKFSVQTLIIGFAALALLAGDPVYILIILGIAVGATVLSRGYYLKILYSHFDFIRFWSKNWPLLGGHQIEDSPVYRERDARLSPGVVYNKSLHGHARFLYDYLRENYYIVFAIAALALMPGAPGAFSQEIQLISLLCIIAVAIGMTSYVIPQLRGIGFARQYGKYALPFGTVAAAYVLIAAPAWFQGAAILIVLYYSFRDMLGRLYRLLFRPAGQQSSGWDMDRLQGLFAFVNSLEDPLIFCLPSTYNDLLAFKCRKRVLWGTHTSPTEAFQPILPVLTSPVGEICARYQISHILIDKNYTSAERLGIVGSPEWEDGYLAIYHYDGSDQETHELQC